MNGSQETATPSRAEIANRVQRFTARATNWLREANGDTLFEHVLQVVVKPLEELDEILDELTTGTPRDAAAECADVIITTWTADRMLGYTVGWDRTVFQPDGAVSLDGAREALIRAVTALGPLGIGWAGQNPRKGVTVVHSEVSDQLARVAGAAATLIVALGFDATTVVTERLKYINDRFDAMGVPA